MRLRQQRFRMRRRAEPRRAAQAAGRWSLAVRAPAWPTASARVSSGAAALKPASRCFSVAQLLIECFGARAQIQDLREQPAERGADEESRDALLDRDPDHAEQDREAPGRPLRRGSFFCLHACTRCSARILGPLPLPQQCERQLSPAATATAARAAPARSTACSRHASNTTGLMYDLRHTAGVLPSASATCFAVDATQ